jgi:hypothetical protein
MDYAVEDWLERREHHRGRFRHQHAREQKVPSDGILTKRNVVKSGRIKGRNNTERYIAHRLSTSLSVRHQSRLARYILRLLRRHVPGRDFLNCYALHASRTYPARLCQQFDTRLILLRRRVQEQLGRRNA